MPFTIGGDWVSPEEEPAKQTHKHPVKIFKEKRRGSWVTLVKNLPLDKEETKDLARQLKSHLGCGGSIKDGVIELQGDKVDATQAFYKRYRGK